MAAGAVAAAVVVSPWAVLFLETRALWCMLGELLNALPQTKHGSAGFLASSV